MLTLCMATQWNIMETRKGKDLCHFTGKAKKTPQKTKNQKTPTLPPPKHQKNL